jgi:hypothetical protein
MRALFCAASANSSPTAFLIVAAVVGILIFGAVLYRFVIKESRQNNTQAMFLSVIALALVGAPVWSTISLKFGKVGVDLNTALAQNDELATNALNLAERLASCLDRTEAGKVTNNLAVLRRDVAKLQTANDRDKRLLISQSVATNLTQINRKIARP